MDPHKLTFYVHSLFCPHCGVIIFIVKINIQMFWAKVKKFHTSLCSVCSKNSFYITSIFGTVFVNLTMTLNLHLWANFSKNSLGLKTTFGCACFIVFLDEWISIGVDFTTSWAPNLVIKEWEVNGVCRSGILGIFSQNWGLLRIFFDWISIKIFGIMDFWILDFGLFTGDLNWPKLLEISITLEFGM